MPLILRILVLFLIRFCSFGEGLNEWSVVQLIGFLILVAGIFIFNGYINLTFNFGTAKTEKEESEPLV